MNFKVTFFTNAGNEVAGTFNMRNRDEVIEFIKQQDLIIIDKGSDGEYVIAPENIDMLIIKAVM